MDTCVYFKYFVTDWYFSTDVLVQATLLTVSERSLYLNSCSLPNHALLNKCFQYARHKTDSHLINNFTTAILSIRYKC